MSKRSASVGAAEKSHRSSAQAGATSKASRDRKTFARPLRQILSSAFLSTSERRNRRKDSQPETSQVQPLQKRKGFVNRKNICYMNSCLQALLTVDGFVDDMLSKCWAEAMLKTSEISDEVEILGTVPPGEGGSKPPAGSATTDLKSKSSLYESFIRLILEARSSKRVLDATDVKEAVQRNWPNFAGEKQQDALECFEAFMDILHKEMEPSADTAFDIRSAADVARDSSSSSSDPGITVPPHGDIVHGDGAHSSAGDTKNAKPTAKSANKADAGIGMDNDGVRGEFPEPRMHSNDTASGDKTGSAGTSAGGKGCAPSGASLNTDKRLEEIPLIKGGKAGLMPTNRHFVGEIEVTILCSSCDDERTHREPFNHLSLALPTTSSTGQGLSLDEMLKDYCRPEMTERRCEKCNASRAILTRTFTTLPGTLVLSIGRLRTIAAAPSKGKNRNNLSLVKDNTPVKINATLDLRTLCTPNAHNPPVYDLGERVQSMKEVGTSCSKAARSSNASPGTKTKDARTNTALEAPTTSTEEEQLEQALRASRKEAEAAHGRSGRESELSSDKAFASNMQEAVRLSLVDQGLGGSDKGKETGRAARGGNDHQMSGKRKRSMDAVVKFTNAEHAPTRRRERSTGTVLNSSYCLTGVVHHKEHGHRSGHYVTDARDRSCPEHWIRLDDSKVSTTADPTSSSGTAHQTGYLFFYSLERDIPSVSAPPCATQERKRSLESISQSSCVKKVKSP